MAREADGDVVREMAAEIRQELRNFGKLEELTELMLQERSP